MATFHAVETTSTSGDLALHQFATASTSRASAHCAWDLQADTWEWDADLAGVFGRHVEAFVPSTSAILETKHPDDLEMSKSVVESVRSHGSQFSYASRIFRADGRVRAVHAAGRVSSDSNGDPALVRATIEALGDWTLPFAECEVADATDGELMLGLRARLPEAFAEAFRRHSESVAKFARRFGALNPDDVVQDVFESLCRWPERFDARRGSLRTYLSLSARTRCFDEVRSESSRRRRDLAHEQNEIVPPADVEAFQAIRKLHVQAALSQIRPEERAAIELAFFGGFTYRAVAELLGVPEGTAKSRIRNGLVHLRATLGRLHPDLDSST